MDISVKSFAACDIFIPIRTDMERLDILFNVSDVKVTESTVDTMQYQRANTCWNLMRCSRNQHNTYCPTHSCAHFITQSPSVSPNRTRIERNTNRTIIWLPSPWPLYFCLRECTIKIYPQKIFIIIISTVD